MGSIKLYFGGAELGGWRDLLLSEGVTHVSMSFVGLSRRNKLTKPWLVSEKFDSSQTVFLDSGAYSVNKDPAKYSKEEIQELADKYMAFAYANIDSLEMVSEFDALPLGFEWIKAMREDFYDDLGDKFLPIWHPEYGIQELENLASKYERVGIMQTALGDRNLAPKLNGLVTRYGTKLHGVAMSKMDVMKEIKWDSVGSKSWLNTSSYGETFVWTGNGLSWYPSKMKDQARKRHRNLFQSNGFDVEKIENDDTTELLKLAIWSWSKFVEDLNRKKNSSDSAQIVTNPLSDPFGRNSEADDTSVDNPTNVTPQTELMPREPKQRQTIPLPIIGVTTRAVGENGETEVIELVVRGESARECNTCFLSDKCPAYEPGSTCAFNVPVVVKTLEDVKQIQNSLIAIQTQRVMFMQYVEDKEGGYVDANLTKEIGVLSKLIKSKQDSEEKGFSITMTAKEKGEVGMFSRLFGSEAEERANTINAPNLVERLAVESGLVVDADVIDE